jgi:hypothetical protein
MTVYAISDALFHIVVPGKSCYRPTVVAPRGYAPPHNAMHLSTAPHHSL